MNKFKDSLIYLSLKLYKLSFVSWLLNKLDIVYDIVCSITTFNLFTLATKINNKERLKSLIKRLAPYHVGKDLIRLGPDGDGGYLVPDDLKDIKYCFSPGVDTTSGFEADCYKRGMKLYLADKSVKSPNLQQIKFDFTKKFIGFTDNDDFMTLESWINTSNINQKDDLLLQMDIEGWEYISILSTPKKIMNRFRIIIIEFHGLQDLWGNYFFNVAEGVFDKLLETHTCAHLHPNNNNGISQKGGIPIPRLMEFTFIRNDRVTSKKRSQIFPHPLDVENTNSPAAVLPKCWYQD